MSAMSALLGLNQAALDEVEKLRLEVRLRGEEIGRLRAILNTPLLAPFAEAVIAEAKHQRFIGREANDLGKTPFDWFWTLGFLSQKAAQAEAEGDLDKALHHTISSAALLANWHRLIAERKGTAPPAQPSAEDAIV